MSEYAILSIAAVFGSFCGVAFSLAVAHKSKKLDSYKDVLDSCEFHKEVESVDEGR